MTPETNPPKRARIYLPSIDGIVGGTVVETHENGDVTILWAGLRKCGRPISLEDMLEIEAGR